MFALFLVDSTVGQLVLLMCYIIIIFFKFDLHCGDDLICVGCRSFLRVALNVLF